jgi:hypothetical protein
MLLQSLLHIQLCQKYTTNPFIVIVVQFTALPCGELLKSVHLSHDLFYFNFFLREGRRTLQNLVCYKE